ncbi:hypothetical protein FT663_00253 [Candidozyma haemuli var. vulneris]|nr:hypothetical protein FT662_00503 [[Candida] haemuloni var. vulneris]KAF3995657.1 hypothetical protein FT663_00253 [[Candida] haemuloni var. vulneris]
MVVQVQHHVYWKEGEPQQSFTLIDIKLGLGLVTVAIAGFLFWLDKNYSFNDSYYVIAGSVALYFVISTVLLYFTSGPGYKNNKYVGKKKKDTIAVFAWTTKYDPIYNVKVVLNGNEQGAVTKEIPFNKIFDQFGYFNQDAAVQEFGDLVEKKSQ